MSSSATRLFFALPPRFRDSIVILRNRIKHPHGIRKNLASLKRIILQLEKTNPSIVADAKIALRLYCQIRTKPDKCAIYLNTYAKQNVRCVQCKSKVSDHTQEPILICAVKDDLAKVQMQIDHHKKIGIKHFVYIDNMSTDGTYEWLLEQDVNVYRTDDDFSAIAKNAWFRQITDRYGYDRWYLVLDSDELFVYPGMEHGPIGMFTRFLEDQQLSMVQSFLIDMYPKDNDILSQDEDLSTNLDIRKEYCYFDTDSYSTKQTYKGLNILGGPRARCFSEKGKDFSPLLTKNPLMKIQATDVFGVHRSLPYSKNIGIPIAAGLLHYKFLPGDDEKYAQIVKAGNYSGGSAEYKQYLKVLEKKPSLSFYYGKSEEFTNSEDLLKINVFSKEFSQKFLKLLGAQGEDK